MYLPSPVLFGLHGTVSVSMILLNKSIVQEYQNVWTVVAFQQLATLILVPFLHISGIEKITPLRRKYWVSVGMMSVWLVGVLWASIKALEYVSVPLYVVARNSVPFQTLGLERFFLGRQVSNSEIIALIITFSGTMLYTLHDNSAEWHGLGFAFLNTVLVSTCTVYDRSMMSTVKKEYSAMDMNFWRALLAMPFVLSIQFVYEGPHAYMDLFGPAKRYALLLVAISGVFAVFIGTLLLALQARFAATSIHVANIFYKFVTTVISTFTHPTGVPLQGWLGYLICTAGFCLYTFPPGGSGGQSSKKKS